MRHWAPVTRMYTIALMTWRISRLRGRPPNLAAGIKSLIQSQWRSARSVGYVCVFIPQVYPTQSADRHPFQTASKKLPCFSECRPLVSKEGNGKVIEHLIHAVGAFERLPKLF